MSEEKINKLGTYFVHFNILETHGIPFYKFVEIVEAGTWGDYV